MPEVLRSPKYLIGKRVFDILFSAGAIAVSWPLMLIIAIVIKATSRGPVMFRQERIGQHGRPFTMFKFRSMIVNDLSATGKTVKDDPRITVVGAFLRRTSLDELPQFFNVLRGDMSVVGPRPEIAHFVQKFRREIPSYMKRHVVKCGITGWAQVNGLRGSYTSMAKRIEYDLHYMRNWSFTLDMKIILMTILAGAIRNAL